MDLLLIGRKVFMKILNMSVSASLIVLAVILLRIFLKKSPKWINCILWGIVAIRLICPFSIESGISMMPGSEPINTDVSVTQPYLDTGIQSIPVSIQRNWNKQ